ncbi:MAG TPA: SRPBCC family protein [Actinomycetota bacterium]|jgi:hypothetical protein|nr:SRPBCC family protein [Actinomycetota bacterium]
MRRFSTSRSRRIGAQPARVMELVRDSGSWPRWQSEIRTARGPARLEAGDVVDGTAEMLGFGVHGRSTITQANDGRLEEDAIVGVSMKVTFVVEPHPNGAMVTHHMVADLPRGPLGSLLAFFLKRRLVRMQRATLERLVDQAEASDS